MDKSNEMLMLDIMDDGILENFQVKDRLVNSSIHTEELREIHVQRGKGKLVQGGARISRGVTGSLTVDIKVHTISQENFKEIVNQVTRNYKSEHHEELEQHSRQNTSRTSWLLGLFGVASGNSYDNYQNQKSFTASLEDTVLRNSVKEIFNKAEEECTVTGSFTMVGMGTETTATVFAEIMVIESADRKEKIQIVSDRATVGDINTWSGANVRLESDDHLDIVSFM